MWRETHFNWFERYLQVGACIKNQVAASLWHFRSSLKLCEMSNPSLFLIIVNRFGVNLCEDPLWGFSPCFSLPIGLSKANNFLYELTIFYILFSNSLASPSWHLSATFYSTANAGPGDDPLRLLTLYYCFSSLCCFIFHFLIE